MKNVNRRKFLKLAGIGGASVALPSVGFSSNYSSVSNKSLSEEDFFPIMPWDEPAVEDAKTDEIIKSIKDCNYTMAGYVPPEKLAICEELGLKAIVTIPGGPHKEREDWSQYSDEDMERLVKNCLSKANSSKAMLGMYAIDEPVVGSFKNIGRIVSTIKRLAPDIIAYMNLFGNEVVETQPELVGTASYPEYLERTFREINPSILSWDNYTIQYSMDQRDSIKAAYYYDNLIMGREFALKKGIPFWNCIIANQIRPYTTIPSIANLSLQAFTSLAAGVSGISWFTFLPSTHKDYFHTPVDFDGNKSLTWYYLREVNRQIKILGPVLLKTKSTGVYFSGIRPSKLCSDLPGRVVGSVESDTSLMIGEFKGEDADYVMVVNISLEKSTKFELNLNNKANIEIISSADGKSYPMVKVRDEWLTAGQGILLKIS